VANLIFYVMAAGAVLFAAGVVLLRTPIASVISLLGSFFCLATIYLVAGFPFLAAVQILVYAGAVLVLFLFVIMLLNLTDATALPRLDQRLLGQRHLGFAAAISIALLGIGLLALNTTELATVDPALVEIAIDAPLGIPVAGEGSERTLGLAGAMFTTYLLPFEATSLLLLATAVAVMVLAKRQRPNPHGSGTAARSVLAPSDGGGSAVAPPAQMSTPEPQTPAPAQEARPARTPAPHTVPAGGSK